ncbi:hypothetical protein [Ammoniphilus sp. YIM 78166]|uniref:hypothetical protein n=1 Tax=Ammoniphilus sp. YIM 78166 TaxID=1644106 RepID=UPI00106FE00C|nr:hypothetical protein [Ammoniphilus sp. YIM 78166]
MDKNHGAIQLIQQIKDMEETLLHLKRELAKLQQNCIHDDRSNLLMKTCQRCLQSESIYY